MQITQEEKSYGENTDEGNYIDYSFYIIWIVTVNPPKSCLEEKEIAASVSTTRATSGLQVPITHKMRNVLQGELGYHPDEVNEMYPEVKKNNEMSNFRILWK